MKKQILSLMLSASILTASPLFAMEDPNDPSHKTAIKQTSPVDDSEKAKTIKAFQEHQRAYQAHLRAYKNRCIKQYHLSSGTTAFGSRRLPDCEHLRQLMDQAYKNMKKYSDNAE